MNLGDEFLKGQRETTKSQTTTSTTTTKTWVVTSPFKKINLCLPGGSEGTESACNAGDLGSVPGLGKFPGGGLGNPLQYSFQENPHEQTSYGRRQKLLNLRQRQQKEASLSSHFFI